MATKPPGVGQNCWPKLDQFNWPLTICIKATAKYGISDVAYFIMAMQDDRFENCNTADILCRVSAPLPEPYSTAMKHCKRLENGEITSCPQGWVKADAIEPYPNGLQ